MKKVWFTSDTHFGHKRIPFYAKRRFCLSDQEEQVLDSLWEVGDRNKSKWSPSWASISKMDEYLIRQINQVVGKDDILWHLGDFCFGRKNEIAEVARKYRARINCRNVFLILGNHDNPTIKTVFDKCYENYEIKVNSQNIVLSHYSYVFWNRSHYGSWMLYGHAHGSAEKWLDENMPGRLSMDVGVDNAYRIFGEYRPFSFDEISSIFSGRKGFYPDSTALQTQKVN